MRPLLLAALLALPLRVVAAGPDWSADPVRGVRGELAPKFSPSQGASPAPSFAGQPGQFDYYVLSLEWHPAFCAGHGGLEECRPPATSEFDHDLVLHGMWPSRSGDRSNSYGFCGVSAAIRALDTPAQRCQMPEVPMSAATRGTLNAHMPGTDACLERHEWYRHGTCSGLSGDAYFGAADAMLLQAISSAVGRFVAAHAGSTVSGSDVVAAAVQDWGGKAQGAVRLNCVSAGGGQTLSEVRLTLSPSVSASSSLGASLTGSDLTGNCPASFTILGGPSR